MESFKVNGYKVRIEQDCDASDPRKDYDEVGTMVCWHHNYRLGDRQPEEMEIAALRRGGFPLLRRYLRMTADAAIVLPLGLLDHSGLHIYIGGGSHWTDSAGWDSGTVGFIYCTRKQVNEEWAGDVAAAERYLEATVETYDQYLRGDVYYYTIEKPDGETVDNCGGFFGYDYVKQEARAAAKSLPRLRRFTLRLQRNLSVTLYPSVRIA